MPSAEDIGGGRVTLSAGWGGADGRAGARPRGGLPAGRDLLLFPSSARGPGLVHLCARGRNPPGSARSQGLPDLEAPASTAIV